MGEWLPISSAPRDGTIFLVWGKHYEWPEVVKWERYSPADAEEVGEDGYWTYAEELLAEVTDSCCPEDWTHWQPLPDPPQ